MYHNLTESQLSSIWQHQMLAKTRLVTEGGETIEIVYPGRANDDQGADFRDAVVMRPGGLIKGDIELHIKSRSWQEHRHHQDAVYNRVILHVVMWDDANTATKLQNGQEVPVLALHQYLEKSWRPGRHQTRLPDTFPLPCRQIGQRHSTGTIARFLDRAGTERFDAKAARFQADLRQTGASQSLYQGVMGALGYSRNKLPFLELARHVPLRALEAIIQEAKTGAECLARQQALLLGTAGLLPMPHPDRLGNSSGIEPWQERWARLGTADHYPAVMSPHTWHRFKVRPQNSPQARLLAMSYLLLRYKHAGLLVALVNLVKEAPANKGHRRLATGLLVTTDGNGVSDLDPGSDGRHRTLLGGERAASIVVNVLLPFTFAWSQATAQPELARKALSLYQSHPRLAANTVERHMMRQLGLTNHLVNFARRQQGLLHIYENRCTQGECDCCPLKNPS